MSEVPPDVPEPRDILRAAVSAIGGSERDGQMQMADAVADALSTGEHLLVQAGTGTGKSLGYLAPVLAHALAVPESRAVVATATLALQAQLVTKDVPVVLDAIELLTGTRPKAALLKGRSNYACVHRVRDSVAAVSQEALVGAGALASALRADAEPETVLGVEVVALREWAEEQLASRHLADRDDAPPHSAAAWAQVSVPARECLGVARCPFAHECFVEASRDRAREADLVVTNHALLAYDALHGGTALPGHDVLVIDEAHELVARVTGAASAELSPALIERAGKRALPFISDDEVALELLESADGLRQVLEEVDATRVTDPSSSVVAELVRVRMAARAAVSAMAKGSGSGLEPDRVQASAAVQELFDVAQRMAALAQDDVVWVSDRDRFGRQVVVAPLSVSDLLRDSVLPDVTAVFTSATLKLGGEFTTVAGQFGLPRSREGIEPHSGAGPDVPSSGQPRHGWRGIDVGSPFDYRRQGILYVARHLPPPSRDGVTDPMLEEIVSLVEAAGGRTLGLFASHRNAVAAASHVRMALPELTVLCQGDAQLPELTSRFLADPSTCLFGTLSLWQGVDVPGETCQLVIIDKIPFPRPDEPLLMARQEAVVAAGGNGFMQVAATHAGLLLAQGSGRLVRRLSDRGVVAVLDPRLVTARYGSFLTASMPSFWQTTNREQALGALRRLHDAARSGTSSAS